MKSARPQEHKTALVLRLKRIEGQLRGIQRLIEQDAPCEAIAQQIAASRRALEKTYHALVACLVESHLGSNSVAKADFAPIVEMLRRYS